MTPAAEDSNPAVQPSAPLLSRRRGSLSNSPSSSSKNELDIEQGGLLEEEPIGVRVKTAGDGREYNVSSTLATTVAQVGAR